jgi:hypothetical protein
MSEKEGCWSSRSLLHTFLCSNISVQISALLFIILLFCQKEKNILSAALLKEYIRTIFYYSFYLHCTA